MPISPQPVTKSIIDSATFERYKQLMANVVDDSYRQELNNLVFAMIQQAVQYANDRLGELMITSLQGEYEAILKSLGSSYEHH